MESIASQFYKVRITRRARKCRKCLDAIALLMGSSMPNPQVLTQPTWYVFFGLNPVSRVPYKAFWLFSATYDAVSGWVSESVTIILTASRMLQISITVIQVHRQKISTAQGRNSTDVSAGFSISALVKNSQTCIHLPHQPEQKIPVSAEWSFYMFSWHEARKSWRASLWRGW